MLYLGWTYISSGSEVADKWLDGYMIELILSMDARIFINSLGSCSVWSSCSGVAFLSSSVRVCCQASIPYNLHCKT